MDFSKYENKLTITGWRTVMKDLIAEIDNTPLTKTQREEAIAEAERRAKAIERQQRGAYNFEDARLRTLFETDCASDLDFEYLPKDVQRKVFDYAWTIGHSGGYSDVYYNLCDIASIVIAAYESGKGANNV